MERKNIQTLIDDVKYIVDSHKIASGTYARWILEDGTDRKMGVNEYGCADAANILYSIGEFPQDAEERKEWIRVMQDMQDARTGLFVEGTHHTLHTTAHVAAALELFDAKPKYRFSELDKYRTREGLYQFLNELKWDQQPWDMSHRGAGIYAAMNVAGEATAEWNTWYFEWFWEESCPKTGMWRKGCVTSGTRPVHEHMAGTFHYLFNHEHAHMPLRYPEKLIDCCLELYANDKLMHQGRTFGEYIGFLEIDWVFCITRALRQCPHRFYECVKVLEEFADKYTTYLMSLDVKTHPLMDDMHQLFGAVCCLAELQSFLPGKLMTDKPLKLVLDRRPFI